MTTPTCRTCNTPITKRSKTGLCCPCMRKDPEINARKSASVRKAYQTDPEYKAQQRARLVERNQSEAMRTMSGRRAKELRIWELGKEAMTPEVRKRAGITISAKRLAHIPPERRKEYRTLTSRRWPKEEAARIVLEQHERDMAKFVEKLKQETW